MNEPDRLTPGARDRLLRRADEAEAKAAEVRACAAQLAEGGGYREAREADKLGREAARFATRAARFRERAARSAGRVRSGRLTVSDHALVRFLERRYRLDLSALYAEVLPPDVAAVAARLGDGEYPVAGPLGPHRVVVQGGCVVTVVAH